jgi:hypothetical protein
MLYLNPNQGVHNKTALLIQSMNSIGAFRATLCQSVSKSAIHPLIQQRRIRLCRKSSPDLLTQIRIRKVITFARTKREPPRSAIGKIGRC